MAYDAIMVVENPKDLVAEIMVGDRFLKPCSLLLVLLMFVIVST